MEPAELIGLDIGHRHTGMARASSVAMLPHALKNLPTNEVLDELRNYMTSHEIKAIVIGLPRNLSGDDTEQTRWVRHWANELKKSVDLPLYFQDEALTSSNQKNDHASAAATILEDFINTPEEQRIRC